MSSSTTSKDDLDPPLIAPALATNSLQGSIYGSAPFSPTSVPLPASIKSSVSLSSSKQVKQGADDAPTREVIGATTTLASPVTAESPDRDGFEPLNTTQPTGTSDAVDDAHTGAEANRTAEQISTDPQVKQPPSVQPSRRSSRRGRRSRSNSADREKPEDLETLLTFLGDDYELYEVTAGGGLRKVDNVPDKKTLQAYKRNFIIRRKTTQQRAHEASKFTGGAFDNGNADRFDYEKRYPPDEPGKGMEPNARVWRVYLDEAGQFDADMVENMRDTVDVILVFASLFSGIVTTLVALTETALQLD